MLDFSGMVGNNEHPALIVSRRNVDMDTTWVAHIGNHSAHTVSVACIGHVLRPSSTVHNGTSGQFDLLSFSVLWLILHLQCISSQRNKWWRC